MSAEEDTELRDLVAQTLEANGVLGKIRVNIGAVGVSHHTISLSFHYSEFCKFTKTKTLSQ